MVRDTAFWEGDKRPKRYGWAPGGYMCRCHDCKEEFIGDKRAILCAPCAYMRPPNPTPRPVPNGEQ